MNIKELYIYAYAIIVMNEGDISAFNILIGKRTTKSPLGRPRHRWEDKI